MKAMKLHPTRNKQATKGELRGRMMTEILTSTNGQRVLRECQGDLDLPVNSDETSRKFVVRRFATELDIYDYELEDLLKRFVAEDIPEKPKRP
jgi:hypothetical protein